MIKLPNPRTAPSEDVMFEIHETDKADNCNYYGTIIVGYKQGSSLDNQWNKIIDDALEEINGRHNDKGELIKGAAFPHVNEINWQLEYIGQDFSRQIVRIFKNK